MRKNFLSYLVIVIAITLVGITQGQTCHSSCATCRGSGSSDCTSCELGKVFNTLLGTCYGKCKICIFSFIKKLLQLVIQPVQRAMTWVPLNVQVAFRQEFFPMGFALVSIWEFSRSLSFLLVCDSNCATCNYWGSCTSCVPPLSLVGKLCISIATLLFQLTYRDLQPVVRSAGAAMGGDRMSA
mgnify:CR=1 FL=1